MINNIDTKTVDGFGDEWVRFDQSKLSNDEAKMIFESYFSIFPWEIIKPNSIGFDLGCGSGRWAKFVSPRVAQLYCIEPSKAIYVAKSNLSNYSNIEFQNVDLDSMLIEDNSMDFGYSLGVLHHIPNTQLALDTCVNKLKKGAPFLLYLYYNFDNKPFWYKFLWELSEFFRKIISQSPYNLRYFYSQLIAFTVYLPLARFSLFLNFIGFNVSNFPLSAYRKCSFYTMRTDALDRFGTRLEQRFSKNEIENMMIKSGLWNIKFNSGIPFWCAVGYKKD